MEEVRYARFESLHQPSTLMDRDKWAPRRTSLLQQTTLGCQRASSACRPHRRAVSWANGASPRPRVMLFGVYPPCLWCVGVSCSHGTLRGSEGRHWNSPYVCCALLRRWPALPCFTGFGAASSAKHQLLHGAFPFWSAFMWLEIYLLAVRRPSDTQVSACSWQQLAVCVLFGCIWNGAWTARSGALLGLLV